VIIYFGLQALYRCSSPVVSLTCTFCFYGIKTRRSVFI